MAGHFKKHNVEPFKVLKEFRVSNPDEYQLGQELKVNLFAAGDIVDVQGVSIGKGFQGVIKRHGFGGGPAAHGSDFHRAPGSIGMREWPGETLKGKNYLGEWVARLSPHRDLKLLKSLKIRI